MIKAPSLVIATISIAVSLVSLASITASWDIVGWPGLWAYVVIMVAIFGAWILVMTKVGVEKNPLKTMDFAIIAMFAAILVVVDFGSMFVPGLTVLWFIIPQFAGAILAYFPMGLVIAAAMKLSPKPGSALLLILVYGIIATLVFFFNPIWFTRIIFLALGIEAFNISSKQGTRSSLLLMGLIFGTMISSSAAIYEIYTWGFWQPLFVTLPAAVFSGIMAGIGALLGFALGERAKTVMY